MTFITDGIGDLCLSTCLVLAVPRPVVLVPVDQWIQRYRREEEPAGGKCAPPPPQGHSHSLLLLSWSLKPISVSDALPHAASPTQEPCRFAPSFLGLERQSVEWWPDCEPGTCSSSSALVQGHVPFCVLHFLELQEVLQIKSVSFGLK